MTKDEGLFKNVIIFDQPIPLILVYAIMEKSDTFQLIFSSTTIEHKAAFS